MPVSGDPFVDTSCALAAVDDGAPDVRSRLFDSAHGTAKDSEGKIGFIKRPDERGELELLLHVDVNVFGGEIGGGKVGCSVAGVGRRQKGDVPTKLHVLEKLGGVKIGFEGGSPGR